jgi:hypothetical protein
VKEGPPLERAASHHQLPLAFTSNFLPTNQRRCLHTFLHTLLRFTVSLRLQGISLPSALALSSHTLSAERPPLVPLFAVVAGPQGQAASPFSPGPALRALPGIGHWALSRQFTREERVTTFTLLTATTNLQLPPHARHFLLRDICFSEAVLATLPPSLSLYESVCVCVCRCVSLLLLSSSACAANIKC